MANQSEEAADIHAPELLASPAFAHFFEGNAELVAGLRKFNLAQLIAAVGGMLTMPEWQASTLRLEVLQHLVIANAHGTKDPKARDFKSWLSELGEGIAGALEDPSEDVFVSRVFLSRQDCLVFEGIYEASAFHLQRFLNILEGMPDSKPYAEMKRAAYGLLRLSDEVATRAGIAAFTVGQTEPLLSVPSRLFRGLPEIATRVTFSQDQLSALGIDLNDLAPFIFDPTIRETLREERLGHSSLERFPVVCIRSHVYLALPTAVSIAVRRMVIEFCLATDMSAGLYSSLAKEMANTFADVPLLGGRSAPPLQFQKLHGSFVANVVRYIDEGRLLHLCFVLDAFDAYSETGMTEANPDPSRLGKAIEMSIAHTHKEFASKEDFREGLSLLVLCSWGRPLALTLGEVEDVRWRFEHISAPDLEAISWEPMFSPLLLWRLLDARDRLLEMNVELFNVNGLLNLYAWSEALEGHLVPHGELPDEQSPDTPLRFLIPQNGLLDVRKRAAQSWNVHHAKTWDGRDVKVRRDHTRPFFEEDHDAPVYVSIDDLQAGKLVAVFETAKRGWWATVETANGSTRDFHDRLWHAAIVWLRRAAPVLEDALTTLPHGPVAWICRFEDSNVSNPAARIPTRLEASTMLEITVNDNVIRIRAKEGFLFSFHSATNMGESLLVESLVTGALRLSGVEATANRISELTSRIVPDEWARDMHVLAAQQFRDFVRDTIAHEPILISKDDDAYSRIGLGWRARERSEGSRIEGITACCAYLASVVDTIWEETQPILKRYNREALLTRLVENNESIMIESEQWLRTARAILALHRNKEQTARASADRLAKFNAGSLSTRILIEMALCECPETGGEKAGQLDIARLLANVMQMHYLGGWFEAIKYGGMKAEVRVTPLGDIHAHVDFDEKIVGPYGRMLGVNRFQHGARGYERLFREFKVVESARTAFNPEFWDAWTETFGFTIDELRVFMDNLDDEGIARKTFAFTSTFAELVGLEKAGKLQPRTVRSILDALSLKPRITWASTPSGFAGRDWYPWRFRRRLSLIGRPVLQLADGDDARYLIAPGLVRDGAVKLIDYCFRGGYEAKDFPHGPMRAWIGAAENDRGHKFNKETSDRLRELGWQTESDIKLTEILNDKLERDYGDIDVLAWRGSRVLAIECKDLELAMTAGEIARQIHEFRGEDRTDGKPDRLKRHLSRVALLKQRAADVKRFTRVDVDIEIETCLVFSDIVPMHFSEMAARHNIRLAMFHELETI